MRQTLRTVVAVAAASAALACTGPASAAATATPSADANTSSPAATCGPDGQLSMSQNTSLYNSQTPTPGHAVYATTVIVNSIGALPHAEIRLQIIPEMQGVTRQPSFPSIEWKLDGGAWRNPQASWKTDVSGSPYWMGPDLAIGTLTTGTHKVEVSFTFATGDLYGAYGADVYLDADKCSAGGDLSTYGSGYVSAAFDGPSSVAGSSGSGGTSGSSASSAKGATTHSGTPLKSTPTSNAPTPTASAVASPSEPSTTNEPSSNPAKVAAAQDVAVQNTAAASSFTTSATLGLIVLAGFALGGFIVLGRRRRISALALDTGPTTDNSDGTEGPDSATPGSSA